MMEHLGQWPPKDYWKKKKMKSPESFEKAKIREHLKTINAWCFAPFMAGMGQSGVPDIIACYRTMFIGIEVKRPGKAPTPIQWRRIAEIQARGGIAIWGDAQKVIGELKGMFPSA